jgi:hypothetical protein
MTNLKEAQCYRLFDMLDLDKSGATWRSFFCITTQTTSGRD